jgi:CheY-like chemotaxis protein
MKTILLIENNLEILENLTEGLELEGYTIISANNGLKGIELAAIHMPDLILSEILMDGISGYEVLRLLLNTPKTYLIPFIFSTTKSQKSDKTMALKLGADDYIVKPFEFETLFAMAKLWINTGSKRRSIN